MKDLASTQASRQQARQLVPNDDGVGRSTAARESTLAACNVELMLL